MKAGLIYGLMPHHLDHVGVFAHMANIPLIVTEPFIADQARTFYPDLEVIYWEALEIPEKVVTQFDTIYCSIPRPLFEESFFFAQKLLKKTVHTIWLPHGNSDKGHLAPSFEGLEHDKTALVYGQKMIDFLKQKNVFKHLDIFTLGNFRYAYYQKYQSFYDTLVDKLVSTHKNVVLYAPTWQDAENSSSFQNAWPILIEKLPPHYALVIKPHPNLSCPNIPHHPDVFVLQDFPPIYPLLNRTGIYIGDMSSIGYDFLTFNRPMYFLNPNRRDPIGDPGLFLQRCGKTVYPEEYPQIYNFFEEQRHLSQVRRDVYDYTFSNVKQFDKDFFKWRKNSLAFIQALRHISTI